MVNAVTSNYHRKYNRDGHPEISSILAKNLNEIRTAFLSYSRPVVCKNKFTLTKLSPLQSRVRLSFDFLTTGNERVRVHNKNLSQKWPDSRASYWCKRNLRTKELNLS